MGGWGLCEGWIREGQRNAALLILSGTLTNGRNILVGCESAYRESKGAWQGLYAILATDG